MTVSVDSFLDRRWHKDKYTCLHFAADVWQAETGQDFHERLACLLQVAARERKAKAPERFGVTRLREPASPCFVLMQHPAIDPHIGVFLRGRVLHLREIGAAYEPLPVATFCFNKVRFYA